jgi:LPXTG-motif cell wall-anchored protein
MRRIGLIRLIAVASAATVFGFASPAVADGTIPIHSTQIPTTAKAFDGATCTAPFDDLDADEDGWHFVTQGTASFTSVTLKFHTPGGDVTVTIASAVPTGGPGWLGWLDNAGAAEKHAYLITDAGWTLFEGSADVTGDSGEFFNLSHTCAGTPTTPSPEPSPSAEPSSESPTEPGSPTGSTPPLPRTGAPIIGMVVTAGIALAGGTAMLLFLRRRRDAQLAALSSMDE